MKNKQKGNLIVELVIVLALVAYGLWVLKNPSTPPVETPQSTDSVNDTANDTTSELNNYETALLKYQNARIQLNSNCQASPNNVTYKNNTSIMIDNRAPVARKVKVGSSFSVGAWGFKIVKLTSATLPATWYIDCDSSQNVATILIQK